MSRSSAETKCRVVDHVVTKCCWLGQLLQELHISVPTEMVVYCDNMSIVYMMANSIHHRCTKHNEIDIHFVPEKVSLG